MQIFNFCDGHMTTFWQPSWAYICQMPGLQTSKRHTFRVSAFHRYHWFGVKLSPVGCAQDSRIWYPKMRKSVVFGSGSTHAIKFWNFFHDSTRPRLHFDGFPPKSRRSVVSLQVFQKHSRSGLAWSRPRADRGLSRPTSVFRTTISVCKL